MPESNILSFATTTPKQQFPPVQQSFLPPVPQSISILPISPSGTFSQPTDTPSANLRKKAESADPLRSHSDYTSLCNYFLNKNQIRNYALLTIGIATGLRISDLLSLKVGHLWTADATGKAVFKDAIRIEEQKTGKKTYNAEDSVLVTEAVQYAATLLVSSYPQKNKKTVPLLTLDDWLFKSKKPRLNEYEVDEDGNRIKNSLYGEYVLGTDSAHRIMKKAQRECGIPINMGTHTMRKTFGCLLYLIVSNMNGGNAAALETVQIAMRHAGTRVTTKYLKITQQRIALARGMISDFLMGKSEIQEISLI
jgi:integrase